MIRFAALLILWLLISGCAAFEPQIRTEPPLEMPHRYALFSEGEPQNSTWWQDFKSPELNALVTEAIKENFDIQTAWARLRQAEAVARQVGAQLLPGIDYDLGAGKSRIQTKATENASTQTTVQKSYRAGLAASYELDLWGRIEAEQKAEIVNTAAAREDLDAAAVTVAAEVVKTWLNIIATRREMAILHEQIQTNETLLKLQEIRYVNGLAKGLDISQQRATLAAARSGQPLLELTERLLFNSLALLLGRSSSQALQVEQTTLPDLIPLPPTGLPVGLLASRPDVRSAGLKLRSADWEVSAARANRLPSLSLSASATFSSGSVDLLFDNWVATLAASITGPLFDAGRRKAEVARTRAVAEERLANYAKTVAGAIKEVEDNIVAGQRQGEYLKLLKDQLQATRLALKAAGLQYRNGQSDYLSYIAAWSSVQNLERQIVSEEANLIKYRVALYRALGGDWTRGLASEDKEDRLTWHEGEPIEVMEN
jgi:multidrug efflux system outer membrane protein